LGPHSYDPGVSPSGVFWTAPVDADGIQVDLSGSEALLRAHHICLFDNFTVPNAITPNHPSGTSRAIFDSLELRWRGFQRRVSGFSNAANKFAGDFVETAATIRVTARTIDVHGYTTFTFVSGPASTTISHFAQIGRERNGAFF